LLAGVAWEEAGGMPDFVKDPLFRVRFFDYSGPDWVHIGPPPGKTSFGAASIQLRVAARELGLKLSSMSYDRQFALARCLETDGFNLEIVAKHLHGLILYDYPKANTMKLSDEQFIVVGSRYNRGTQRKLNDFIKSIKAPKGAPDRECSSYGRTMLKRRAHVMTLLTP
jgi:hypothetical protein